MEPLGRRVAILTSHFFSQSYFAQFSAGKERVMNRVLPMDMIQKTKISVGKLDI